MMILVEGIRILLGLCLSIMILVELSVNGIEQEGGKWSNDSFTMHVVVILYLFRHASMECLEKYTANRIDSFIS